MMATVIALNLDIQLHDESYHLLNINGRIPRKTVYLLYCGLQLDNIRGYHYDALLPTKCSGNDPPKVYVAASTQASISEDIDNLQSFQSTLVSDSDYFFVFQF